MIFLKRLNKLFRTLFALLLIAGISIPTIFTTVQMGIFSSDPVIETKIKYDSDDAPVLKIASDYDFCPNSYYNKDGELSGLYIEIMIEAANRLGMRPEFETDTWLKCRDMLTNDDADVLLGLEIFSNMEGTLRTIPICSDELRVYGKNKIDSAAALAGKKVALMARSVIETTYDLQCEYVEYYTNTEILEAVEKGEVDYGICHGAVATKIIEKNDFNLQSGLVISKSYPALAVKDSNPTLKKQLNKVLQEMSLDGTIGRLQNKWITKFTQNTSFIYVLRHNAVFYITFSLGFLVILCIALAFWIDSRHRTQYIDTLLEYQEKLQKSNEDTVRANLAKSEFLSHMSHDIRTPLNGIMGMVDIIKKSNYDPEKCRECLEKIDLSSNHLLSLINDILDMSKIGSEEVHLEEAPINLNAEVQRLHAIFDIQAKEAGISFEIHMDDIQHFHLLGSPVHFRRILVNLISNALRYNKPQGSVDVFIREFHQNNKTVFFELKVQDTGIGMSKDFIKNSLYEPFIQANNRVRTNYQGSGLGMSIVHALVEKMHGSINVQSELNKGTTFTITLPLKLDPSPEKISQDTNAASANISGMHILVAEDNHLNLEIVEFLLENAGAKITSATDGKQAVDLFLNYPEDTFDAILMDIMMPVMDGLDATRQIRNSARKDAKSIPIIAMTANAFSEDRKKTKEAGMNEHLAKPISSDKLIQLLSSFYKH